MSDPRDIQVIPEAVDVAVIERDPGADVVTGPIPQDVVLVEVLGIGLDVPVVDVTESQGLPGTQGPPGPEGPPGDFPNPVEADLGKAILARDLGAGPLWVADWIAPADVHELGALAVLDQVGTPQIIDGSVTTPKLADGAVTGPKIGAGAVTGAKVAPDSLNSDHWTIGNYIVRGGGGFVVNTGTGSPIDNAFQRWGMGPTGAEAAGNVGSDLQFARFDNAGTYLGTALKIYRANGYAEFSGDIATNANAWVGARLGVTGDIIEHGAIYFAKPGGTRSAITVDTAEAAGNVGSDFNFHHFDNAGGYLRTALSLRRSDGAAIFGGAIWAAGQAFINANSYGETGGFRINGNGGVLRWQIYNSVAETGGNVGSNLNFAAFNDAGAFLGVPLTLTRSGQVLGADGQPFQSTKHAVTYHNASAWVGNGGGIMVAIPGCVYIAVPSGSTINLPDGWHTKVCNHVGGALQIQVDAGIGLYWVNPAGASVTGTRFVAHTGVVEIMKIDGSWHITGTGIT